MENVENELLISRLSGREFLLVIYVLARVLGCFVVSPLFSNIAIPATIRFFFSFFITILISTVLYPLYYGPNATFTSPELSPENFTYLALITNVIKEMSIGYAIGFCFTLIFEATALAGETTDVIMGLATAQFIDPLSNRFQSLLSQFLTLFAFMIMLTTDFHHVFVRVIVNSFSVAPLGHYHMPHSIMEAIISNTAYIFNYAIKLAAVPLVIMSMQTLGIGFTVRVVPELNLLLTGLPMRILIGLYCMMLTISYLPPVLWQAFLQFENLANSIVWGIGQG